MIKREWMMMGNYWNKKAETMSRDEIKRVQSERLVSLVERVYNNVEHYRKKMDAVGLKPSDIKSVDDLKKLPFTYKQDLRDTYPFGLFACPMEDVVRIHASSGTTGKQTVVGCTQNDIEMWKEIVSRALAAANASKKSMVQVSYGYGLFTGGLGAHYGAENMGAAVVPTSSGNTKRQIQCMLDFGATHLCCTPSYALFIAETIEEMGLDIKDFKLEAGIFGAEPWTEEMRKEIERRLGIKAYDIYGLSEIIGPGVSYECEAQGGMHINEDYFIAEIIDPDTGEVLPEGSMGEIVFTTLTKEGLPLIRYRTRDITSLNYEQCSCGRTFVRMNKPQGRSDDMLIIRGVNVFPSQVEDVLLKLGETSPYYMLIVDRVGTLDTLEIQVEISENNDIDAVKGIEALEKKIKTNIESTLGIAAKIKLVEPKSIQRSEGKAVRVIDRRKLI